MKQAYTPIACELYDQLELAAMRGREVCFELMAEGGSRTLTGVIADIWAKDGVEYLRLRSGESFRLDEMLAVDGEGVGACGVGH